MFDSVWNREDHFSWLQMLQPQALLCNAVRCDVFRVLIDSARIAKILIRVFWKKKAQASALSILTSEPLVQVFYSQFRMLTIISYNTYMSDVGFTFLPYLYKLTKFDHQNKWSFGNFFENAKFFAIKLNWPIEENFFHYSSNRVGEIQVVSTFYCKSWAEQHNQSLAVFI